MTVSAECRAIADELWLRHRWQTTRRGHLEMLDNDTRTYYRSLASFTIEQFCRQRNLQSYKIRIVRKNLRQFLMRNPL